MATEPWAILRHHPLCPEVPQHSVNPCLVRSVRNVDPVREPAAQRADGHVLHRHRCSHPVGDCIPHPWVPRSQFVLVDDTTEPVRSSRFRCVEHAENPKMDVPASFSDGVGPRDFSLRRHYPDQVVGVADCSQPLSLSAPSPSRRPVLYPTPPSTDPGRAKGPLPWPESVVAQGLRQRGQSCRWRPPLTGLHTRLSRRPDPGRSCGVSRRQPGPGCAD